MSNPGADGSPRGLFTPGYYRGLTVPVGVIDADADAALRRTDAPVLLTLDAKAAMVKSRNVVAQTKTGDTHNVVVAGAHLDTVAKSPGINDDGTGVAALLETAAALGSQPQITNAVRFAFWGSEETVLAGSTNYVEGLDRDQLNDIALYLELRLARLAQRGLLHLRRRPVRSAEPRRRGRYGASRLGGYRTHAGRLSEPGRDPARRHAAGQGERLQPVPRLRASRSVARQPVRRQRKSEVQARLWGGTAGVAFDRNYHLPGDTVDNVNRDALAVTGPGVAFVVGTYAQSIEGVNGVPSREQRRRHTP